jgi:hypothetical protein
MNRRVLLGSLARRITVPTVIVPNTVADPASMADSPVSVAGSQGAWVKGGIIDAGGHHEPYDFPMRRGGEDRATQQFCDLQQSENVIRALHERGVGVLPYPFL